MAVELAPGEEVREGQLVQDGGAAVGQQLGLGERLDELPRQDEPAEPEPWRQGLACGPRISDPVGIQALHGADRSAVVAVFGVVVVLEDQRPGSLRPPEHGGARLGGEHAPGRPLVRWSEDEDVGVEFGHRVHAHTVVADRHADHVQPQRLRDGAGIVRGRRVLDGHRSGAAGGQHSRQQRHRLRVAAGDDDRLRIGVGSPHTVEVGGERRPKLHRPAAVEVAETLVGGLGENAAHGAQPCCPREGRDVAAAVAEVDHRARRARRAGRPALVRRLAVPRPARAPPACSRRCGWSGTPRPRAAHKPRRRPRA